MVDIYDLCRFTLTAKRWAEKKRDASTTGGINAFLMRISISDAVAELATLSTTLSTLDDKFGFSTCWLVLVLVVRVLGIQ